jgi:hypothetical protein
VELEPHLPCRVGERGVALRRARRRKHRAARRLDVEVELALERLLRLERRCDGGPAPKPPPAAARATQLGRRDKRRR